MAQIVAFSGCPKAGQTDIARQATLGPSPHVGENLVWIHKPDLLKAPIVW